MQEVQADQKFQTSGDRTGRNHLEHRSRLKLRITKLPPVTSILIVDDVVFDADVLASSLRLVFGQGVKITHVRSLRAIRKAIVEARPDLLFLDDRLGHGTSAEVSLKIIRSVEQHVPVIVMSGLLTRSRQTELMKLGVVDVVHKDDSNAVRLSEAILKALDLPASRGTGIAEP